MIFIGRNLSHGIGRSRCLIGLDSLQFPFLQVHSHGIRLQIVQALECTVLLINWIKDGLHISYCITLMNITVNEIGKHVL